VVSTTSGAAAQRNLDTRSWVRHRRSACVAVLVLIGPRRRRRDASSRLDSHYQRSVSDPPRGRCYTRHRSSAGYYPCFKHRSKCRQPDRDPAKSIPRNRPNGCRVADQSSSVISVVWSFLAAYRHRTRRLVGRVRRRLRGSTTVARAGGHLSSNTFTATAHSVRRTGWSSPHHLQWSETTRSKTLAMHPPG
jgi:hypothetical protein